MKTSCSTNPEARQRTIDLLHEKGESVIDWVAWLKYAKGLSDVTITNLAVQRGFIDEEVEGCLRDLSARFGEEGSDFVIDVMLEIRALPTAA